VNLGHPQIDLGIGYHPPVNSIAFAVSIFIVAIARRSAADA
jgi:hypothetical protein